MKKIVIASAAMGGAALLAFGASGTFAAFSDTTAQDVSTVGAGSVVVDSWEKTTAEMAGKPLAPGQSVVRTFYVKNSGTITGLPSAQVLSVTNTEDGCTSNSEEAIDDCTNLSAGDLAAQIAVGYATFDPTGTECTVPSSQSYIPLGRLTDIVGQAAKDRAPLAEGAARCVAFELTFTPGADDNKAQGDSFSAQVQFGLEQSTPGRATGDVIGTTDEPNTPIAPVA